MPNFDKLSFGVIFDFHGFPKASLWITFSPEQSKKERSPPNGPGRTSTDPAFHQTIVTTVPFEPSVFFF